MTETIPTPINSDSDTMTSPLGTTPEVRRFKLNHPKNYLAVPLAVVCDASTDFLIREYAVNLPKRAIHGAEETGLITPDGDLTALGEATVVTASRVHGGVREALEAFGTLHGSPKRFVEVFPEWHGIAKRVAFQYEPTTHLVEFLRVHGSLQLYELTWMLWKEDPALAKTVFLHPGVTETHQINPNTQPTTALLTDPVSYRSECTFQYKAFLYHCGIVDARGDYTSRLEPAEDTWTLTGEFTDCSSNDSQT